MRQTLEKTLLNEMSTIIWNYQTSKLLEEGKVLDEEDKQEVFHDNNNLAATCQGIFMGCENHEEVVARFQELFDSNDDIKNTDIVNAIIDLVANKLDNNEFCNKIFIAIHDCQNQKEILNKIKFGF